MGLTNRQRRAIIPGFLYLNLSWSQSRGWTRSWTIRLGKVWSYNTRQNTSTVKMPFGFKYRHKHGAGVPAQRRSATPVDPELAEARRRVRDLERRARQL